jgi:hypothetical protein
MRASAHDNNKMLSKVDNWWEKKGEWVLRVAVLIMATLAVLRLFSESLRLFVDTIPNSAIDLKFFHNVVNTWFSRNPAHANYTYPPASYLILQPLFGWEDLLTVRWLFAATTVLTLALLVYIVVKESGAATPLEQIFVALIPLAIYATSITIGNGQLTIHIIASLLMTVVLLDRERAGSQKDLPVIGFLLFSLVKPPISIPFFFLLFCSRGWMRKMAIIVMLYIALCLVSASLHGVGIVELALDWFDMANKLGARGASKGSYANIDTWLTLVGLKGWATPAALILLAALGVWLYRNRHKDIWLLAGVAALVSRLWTYHRVYDDLLILIPMISLFRVAGHDSTGRNMGLSAGVLFAIMLAASLAPARLHDYPFPWYLLFTGGQAVIWLGALIFFINQTRRSSLSSGEGNQVETSSIP